MNKLSINILSFLYVLLFILLISNPIFINKFNNLNFIIKLQNNFLDLNPEVLHLILKYYLLIIFISCIILYNLILLIIKNINLKENSLLGFSLYTLITLPLFTAPLTISIIRLDKVLIEKSIYQKNNNFYILNKKSYEKLQYEEKIKYFNCDNYNSLRNCLKKNDYI